MPEYDDVSPKQRVHEHRKFKPDVSNEPMTRHKQRARLRNDRGNHIPHKKSANEIRQICVNFLIPQTAAYQSDSHCIGRNTYRVPEGPDYSSMVSTFHLQPAQTTP